MSRIDDFNQKLDKLNLVGYWGIPRSESFEPKASFAPTIWRWDDVYAALMEAGDVLGMDDSLRRFIAFKSIGKVRTTHTLALGVQLVKPGEGARAPRPPGRPPRLGRQAGRGRGRPPPEGGRVPVGPPGRGGAAAGGGGAVPDGA